MKIQTNVVPDDLHAAEKVLLDAGNQIRRGHAEHGHTHLSFTMVGELWSTYITHLFTMRGNNKLQAQDVAHMLGLLKKARAVYGYSEDNFVDDAGYTSLAAMLTPPPNKTGDKMPVPTPLPVTKQDEQPHYEPRVKPRVQREEPTGHPLLNPNRL